MNDKNKTKKQKGQACGKSFSWWCYATPFDFELKREQGVLGLSSGAPGCLAHQVLALCLQCQVITYLEALLCSHAEQR